MSAIAALPTPMNGAQIAARLAGSAFAAKDNKFTIVGNADATKVLAFTLAGNTTGKTLTLATQQSTNQQLNFPNITATDTLSVLGLAQTFTQSQTFDIGSGTLPATAQLSIMRICSANGQTARFEGTSFGGNGLFFNGVSSGGTRTSPSACTADQLFVGFQAFGYDSSSIVAGSQALLGVAADGAWTGSNRGTYFKIQLTPNGSTTASEVARFSGGNLLIGTTSGITGTGGLALAGTTDSSSTTTGALQCAGGGAFAKSLTIGGSAGNFLNIANSTGALKINGTQVIGPRITGYGTPTGGVNQGSFAAGSITLPNLAACVAQLILDFKTHGVLGT